MEDFLQVVLSLPTVVYSILMVVMVFYWLTVIAGLIDVDLLDFDLDLEMDAELDVDVDVDMDFDVDGDMDVDGIGGFAGVLSGLGLVGVPITVSLTFFVLFNWALTFLGTGALAKDGESLGLLLALGVFAGSFVISLPLTSVAIKPFKPVFRSVEGVRAADAVVGMSVRVLSGSVTDRIGRAEVILDGQPVQVSVRCETKNNGLEKGAEALVIGYDEQTHLYFVESMGEMNSSKPVSQQRLEAKFEGLEEAFSQEEKEVVQEVHQAHESVVKK